MLGTGLGSWREGQTHRASIQAEASAPRPPCPRGGEGLARAPLGLSIRPQQELAPGWPSDAERKLQLPPGPSSEFFKGVPRCLLCSLLHFSTNLSHLPVSSQNLPKRLSCWLSFLLSSIVVRSFKHMCTHVHISSAFSGRGRWGRYKCVAQAAPLGTVP